MSRRRRARRAKERRHGPKRRAVLGATVAVGVALAAPAVGQAAPPSPVTSTDDSGANTLRQAIIDANGNAGADTITFSGAAATLGATIPLNTALPAITEDLTITGPASDILTIDGSGVGDDAMLSASADPADPAIPLAISGLTFANGSHPGSEGGAISTSNVD